MKRVFIVHGHNYMLRDEVATYVRALNLEPIVLTDQANQGGTIIEKFEREARSSDYAIALLTGDDLGGSSTSLNKVLRDLDHQDYNGIVAAANTILTLGARTGEGANHAHEAGMKQMSKSVQNLVRPRARQNVILELGFFIGRLGRGRVCVLSDASVETPSDLMGIVTIPTTEGWQNKLKSELRAAKVI